MYVTFYSTATINVGAGSKLRNDDGGSDITAYTGDTTNQITFDVPDCARYTLYINGVLNNAWVSRPFFLINTTASDSSGVMRINASGEVIYTTENDLFNKDSETDANMASATLTQAGLPISPKNLQAWKAYIIGHILSITAKWTFTGPQPLNFSGLTASRRLELDASKDVVAVAIGTADNKDFGVDADDVPEIASTLAVSKFLKTDASGKLITDNLLGKTDVVADASILLPGFINVDTTAGDVNLDLYALAPTNGGDEVLISNSAGTNDIIITADGIDKFTLITGSGTETTGTIITLDAKYDTVSLKSSGVGGGYWIITGGRGVTIT